ncbi:MAG: hypothetical protein WA426_11335, partial [Silvibacterium sp.]
MKINGNRWALACLGLAVMATPAALAQQQPDASNPYQGVSQPPPDDTIVTTPDTPPPATDAKPSPAIPAVAPTASAATPRPDEPVITTGPSEGGPQQYDNTDYGIVTMPGSAKAAISGDTAVLHTRGDPDADIVTRVPGPSNELPEGTDILVRISNDLSTKRTTVGSSFQGQVMSNVTRDGAVLIPTGSVLRGRVVQVSQGHHFGPAATLRLRPDTVILPDGTAYHLYAQVRRSQAAGTRTASEGGIEPTSHVLIKTAEYGVGVGTGAMVGAQLGGPTGALVGGLVGAGAVTTHLLLQHPAAAVVPAGSEIVFS